uniref:Aldehyde oxidase/xanthine dehydrogenase a/b hammerhead domain-containing protein n=1 Tax=Alexandrium catenella TaxID=2925 RepID=A0A7S1WFK4_ALECA
MTFLEGKAVSEATLQGLLDVVRQLPVEPEPLWVTALRPEGKDEFKRQLLQVMAFRWVCSLVPTLAPGLQSLAQRCGFLESKDAVFSEAQTLSSTAQLGLPEGHPGSVYVGPKMEAYEQACGQTKYSGDMVMGPLGTYGVFVTAQEVGVLEAVDASAALEMEGVVAFVDHASVPGLNSSSFVPQEEHIFVPPGEPVQYAGMIVGLVVATSLAQAKAAARTVRVTVAPPKEPPIFTIEDAVSKKSFLYGPDVPGKNLTVGDPDAAFKDPANVVVEGDFSVGGQNHFYMEKQTVMAAPEDMGRIVIYGGSQAPDATKTRVMMALGCSSKDVVIKNRPMGGSFGGKFTKQLPAFCAAAVACKATGRPVRVAMDIHTDMGCSGNTRHIVKCHYRVAATKEGKLVAFDNKVFADAGFGNDYTDYIVDEIMKRQDLAYDIPHYRGQITICKTNNASCTPVRAPGLAQAAAISETIVEAVARKLKVPQEQVRELSLKPKGKAVDTTLTEIPEWNMPELWATAKEKFDFAAREKAHAEFNAANRFKKRAVALMPLKYAVGYIMIAGAEVTVNINSVDGTVAIQTGCCEMGQGCLTKVIAACASELGIPVEKVSAFYPDTSVLPNLLTDGGSAGAEVLCEATKLACEKLKAILEPVKEELLSEKKASGQEAVATWEEVTNRAQGPMPTDTRTLLSATAQFKVPKWNDLKRSKDHPPPALPFWNLDPEPTDTWTYFVTGVACSEVEVDVTTGEYTLLRSDVLMDAGNSLSPLLDLGQAEGGFVFGLGMYLREEVLIDPESGKNKSQGGWNYWPLTNKDVPRIFNMELLPGNPSSRNSYGSKGVGEPPLILAYSAVSALKKAILASRLERGLSEDFVLDSPATVDRVQQCMGLRPSELSLEAGKP